MARRRSSRERYAYDPVEPSKPTECTPALVRRLTSACSSSVFTTPAAECGVIGKADRPRNSLYVAAIR
jgi:hypothetical protein